MLKRLGAKLARNKQTKPLSRSNSFNSSSLRKVKKVTWSSFSDDDDSSRDRQNKNNDYDYYEHDDNSISSGSKSRSSESGDDRVIRALGTLLTNSGKKVNRDKIDQIPPSVSFVSSSDAGEREYIDYRDDINTWTVQRKPEATSILGVLGDALGFGEDRSPHYIQDLRNLDSDISSSEDELDYESYYNHHEGMAYYY